MKKSYKHKIVIFYCCTYGLTGLLFLASVLLASVIELPLYLLAPAIVALVMIGITQKSEGFQSFLKDFLPGKSQIFSLLIAAILPVIITFIADIASKIFTNQKIDYSANVDSVGILLILTIIVGSFGEEIGWCGYFLPILSQKYGNLIGSLIIGSLWGIWHVSEYERGFGFLLFMITTIEMSIMMTWLYYKSNRNPLTGVAFHAMFNLSSAYIGTILTTQDLIIQDIVFAIPAVLLIIFSPVFKIKDN